MATPPLHQRAMFHKKPDEKMVRYGCFDIETNGLGGPFIAGAWQVEGEESVTFFVTWEEFFKALLSKKNRGVIWYAHNGYEYDLKYLLQWLEHTESGITVECSTRGTRIVRMKIKKNKQTVEIRDSFHVFQKSLKEVSRLFSTEEKGYLDFSKVTYDHDNPEHRDYLRRDVSSLLISVRRIDDILFETFGVHLRSTLPSTAHACFCTTLPEDTCIWRQRKAVEEFCRNAYFGGMVFLRTVQEQTDMVHIDFNAMYASVMRRYGCPVGCATFSYEFVPDKPGFYRVRLNGEAVQFPFIPVRLDKGGVYYPKEETEAYIDSDTYQYALSVGYRIEIIEGYVFDLNVDMFTTFVDKVEAIELPHKKDAIGFTMKQVRNSAYGFFGMRPEATTLLYTDEETDNPAIDEQTGELLFHYEEREKTVEAGYMQPSWAAWITAHARLTLAQAVYAAGVSSVIYGDTDSLVLSPLGFKRALKSGIIQVSNRYGDVKIESRYQYFRAFAPKNYQFIDKIGYPGGKANGVPHKLWSFAGQKHKRVVVVRGGMVTTRTMLKHHTGMTSERQERGYSDIANSSAWQACADGTVEPRTYRKVEVT